MISRKKLMQLYATMVKCRILAERTGELARLGKLPRDWEIGAGSEATLAGVTADLRPEDTVCAEVQPLLWSLIEGIRFQSIFASPALPPNGHRPVEGQIGDLPARQNGHSRFSPDSGSTSIGFSQAIQAAEIHKAANTGQIAVVFQEGLSASNAAGGQMEFVSRHNLPVILLSHLRSASRQPSLDPLRERKNSMNEALAFGVPCIAVDARDVLAVYRVASESISRARQRRGPTLIECVEFGLPDPANSRAANRNRRDGADPIVAMESHLRQKRILTAALKQQLESESRREIDTATKHLMN